MSDVMSSTPETLVSTGTEIAVAEAPTPVAPPANTLPVEAVSGDKTVSVPTSAFVKIKQEAQEKGRKSALSEIEAKAKAFGFGSVDEMFAALSSASAAAAAGGASEAPAAPAPAKTESKPAPKAEAKPAAKADEAHALRVAREIERARKDAEKAAREARKYKAELEKKQAESEMREMAMKFGVREHLDFTLHLLESDLRGMTEEQLGKFDEGEWFGKLRAARPYLFGEQRIPATTGTAGGNAPKAPGAGDTASAAGAAGVFDGMRSSSQDFKARLAALGLRGA